MDMFTIIETSRFVKCPYHFVETLIRAKKVFPRKVNGKWFFTKKQVEEIKVLHKTRLDHDKRRRAECRFIGAHVTVEMNAALDKLMRKKNLSKSKILRTALKNYVESQGEKI